MPGCRWFGAVPSALALGRRFVARTLTGVVCLAAVNADALVRAAEPGGSAAALANDLGQAWAAAWTAASAPDSGARRAAGAEQQFYLVHVAIVTDNGRVNLDHWLPLPGVLGENTPQTGVSYTDAASGQTLRYGFHDFGSGGVICLKLSDTCEYIYDHTIYGYEFGAPATGVLSSWGGYDGMPGYYAILGWEDPPGMTVGTPDAGGRVPVALDYGSLDAGTLVFAPDPATAGVYLAATGGAPLTGTELQFAPAALPDTLYVEPAAAAATRLTARWTAACSDCNLGQVTVNARVDFGDAPAPYPTTLAADGARHTPGGPQLGAACDTEADGLPSPLADGDDTSGSADEDGVTSPSPIRIGQLGATLTVNVQGEAGRLDAWLDFNHDGCWGGAEERIAASVPVAVGDNTIRFDVPSWATAGWAYARFRVSRAGGLGPRGAAPDGEVEDHRVEIAGPARGGGNFGPAQTVATVGSPMRIFAADVDRDGRADVLTAAHGAERFVWHRNTPGAGGPTFTTYTIDDYAYDARGVRTADLDGDGDVDVLGASTGDHTVAWYENDGSQHFTEHDLTNSALFAEDVLAADVDGDGDLDVVYASWLDNTVGWFENLGGGNFTEHLISTSAGGAVTLAAADLNGDGNLDVCCGCWRDDRIDWYENDGNGGFTTHTLATTPYGPCDVIAADVDGDGDLDIVAALVEAGAGEVLWYENDGRGSFTPHVIQADIDEADGVAAADLDDDGDLDILAGFKNDYLIVWYENDGSAHFTPHIVAHDFNDARKPVVADVDGDGDLDVICCSWYTDVVVWFEQYGPGPQMVVRGQGQDIANGDLTPAVADDTDFGTAAVSGNPVTHTFTVANLGAADLTLDGTPPVVIAGTHPGDFTVTATPTSPVTPGGQVTFAVTFAPLAVGLRTALVSLANNDAGANPYAFAIQGNGLVAPAMSVSGGGVYIANGDVTPAVTDDTDFGSALVAGGTHTHTFTIHNTGSADLNLTGTPKVAVSGAHATEFAVTADPTSPVALGGGTTTFTVTFGPMAAGLRTATVAIANDDANSNPYVFAFQGTGVTAPDVAVTGNGVVIANGDSIPAVADDTDFGSLRVGGGEHAHTFTILNLGSADLHLTGTPRVTLSGPHPADFLVWVQPGSPVPAGGSTFCIIRFAPTGGGLRSATVAIANDDADENPYTFAIQGTGTKRHRTVVVETGSDSGCQLAAPGTADGARWLSLGVALLALGAARRRRWFTLGRGRRSA